MATGQKIYLYSKGIDTYDSIQCNIIWRLNNKLSTNNHVQLGESNLSSAMSAQNINLIFSRKKLILNKKIEDFDLK